MKRTYLTIAVVVAIAALAVACFVVADYHGLTVERMWTQSGHVELEFRFVDSSAGAPLPGVAIECSPVGDEEEWEYGYRGHTFHDVKSGADGVARGQVRLSSYGTKTLLFVKRDSLWDRERNVLEFTFSHPTHAPVTTRWAVADCAKPQTVTLSPAEARPSATSSRR